VARIRIIRQIEGAAASVGVGLVLLLAALAWQRYARSGDDVADDAGLAALAADCEAKLRRDARTVSMTPDAPRREAPALGGPRPPAEVPAAAPGTVPDPRGATGGTSAEPEGRLRLTDYGWAAHNMHLRNDPCTRYYRRKLGLGR
jgi:hypothetical protein